jgi:hypothetical protein
MKKETALKFKKPDEGLKEWKINPTKSQHLVPLLGIEWSKRLA